MDGKTTDSLIMQGSGKYKSFSIDWGEYNMKINTKYSDANKLHYDIIEILSERCLTPIQLKESLPRLTNISDDQRNELKETTPIGVSMQNIREVVGNSYIPVLLEVQELHNPACENSYYSPEMGQLISRNSYHAISPIQLHREVMTFAEQIVTGIGCDPHVVVGRCTANAGGRKWFKPTTNYLVKTGLMVQVLSKPKEGQTAALSELKKFQAPLENETISVEVQVKKFLPFTPSSKIEEKSGQSALWNDVPFVHVKIEIGQKKQPNRDFGGFIDDYSTWKIQECLGCYARQLMYPKWRMNEGTRRGMLEYLLTTERCCRQRYWGEPKNITNVDGETFGKLDFDIIFDMVLLEHEEVIKKLAEIATMTGDETKCVFSDILKLPRHIQEREKREEKKRKGCFANAPDDGTGDAGAGWPDALVM